jgi:hypothetical protein
VNPFGYAFSLRLRHPRLTADEITAAVAMAPKRSWTIGEPRSTPKGTPLEGIHTSTYWTSRLAQEEGIRGAEFVHALGAALGSIEEHSAFFHSAVAEGGSANLFIGLFGSGNFGFSLPPDLLGRLAALGVGLEVDIYP